VLAARRLSAVKPINASFLAGTLRWRKMLPMRALESLPVILQE
jgi:hypothetical protein